METELRIAVEFLLSFVVKKFKIENTEGFVQSLINLLTKKFEGHWYPEHPNKGSAYRCISLCDQLDGVLIKAAKESGLDASLFENSLPKRLDLWIDPQEVSYRIGNIFELLHWYQTFQLFGEFTSFFRGALGSSHNTPVAVICFHLFLFVHSSEILYKIYKRFV